MIALYILANVAYRVVLPCPRFRSACRSQNATAMLKRLPGYGPTIMAIAIMISTFCVNSLVLAGRPASAMAK